MEIIRKLEAQVLRLSGDFPVIGILGPRQSGKTTLVKMISGKLGKPTIYLDLENDSDLAKLSDPGIYLQQYRDYCVIIDEIQRMPALFALIRSLVDQQRDPGRFILLGSASPALIRESAESLAGRIAYLELTPFRLDEIESVNDWQKLWLRGGFPLSYLAGNERKSFEWRQFFLQTLIERDMAMSGLSQDPVLSRRFVRMISAMNGNLWNTENISRSLGIHSQTVTKYLNFLDHTFLVNRLLPYSTNSLKRLVKSPKIFIRDSGLLHYLAGIETIDDLYNTPLLGNSWEGFVINQIKSVLGSDTETYFYRTHQGAECDLIIFRGNKIQACIEIKFASAPKVTKGFFISIDDLQCENNFVIIPGDENYRISEKIIVNGLNYFISNSLPGLLFHS